jgi:hypothetical protein
MTLFATQTRQTDMAMAVMMETTVQAATKNAP